jgi:1-deoxy-D-xylulose-5-phosphate synthase
MMDALKRAFDVGIAEQHAVTLSAGMATQGMVFFATSTHFYKGGMTR